MPARRHTTCELLRTARIGAVAAALLLAGCGGSDEPKSSAPQVSTLLGQLTEAGPKGLVTPAEAAEAADRQQAIVRAYLGKVDAGPCRESLRQLATRYSLFESSARALDKGGDEGAYARAAGTISASVESATAACTEKSE
jgi:hypothetical protein